MFGFWERCLFLLFLFHLFSDRFVHAICYCLMRFQGLLGTVDAVSVLKGYQWFVDSLEYMSESDPICSPLKGVVNCL